jgi:type II secretory pathway pseudopilin PulG
MRQSSFFRYMKCKLTQSWWLGRGELCEKSYFQRGQLLVEILVTIGLFAILSPALLNGFTSVTQSRVQQEQRTDSATLLNETQEAVRAVRERGWTSFAVNGTYHPTLNDGVWSLESGPDTIGDLTRTVVISDVYRDNSGAIVESGTLDPSTKKVTTTISWTRPRVSSISATQYITRYLDNLSRTDTTEADFNGTVSNASGSATENVRVRAKDDDGHVELSGTSNGDWCNPTNHIVAQMNLASSGNARNIKAVQGTAYTGTSSGAGTFVKVGISDTDPPVLTNLSTLTGYETKDIFIDGNYAYVATADTNKDVVIIDLNTNTEVGYFNPSNPTFFDILFGDNIPLPAQGVYVVGNVGFVTIGPNLYSFNLTSKTGSRPQLGSVCVSSTSLACSLGLVNSYRFVVHENYAYVAIDYGSRELQLVNVSNPSSMTRAGSLDVNGTRGQEVAVNADGTRAYLATTADGSRRELFIINTSNKNNLSLISSYEANGTSLRGLAAVAPDRLVAVGTGGEEYQVIDISNESNPTRCGGLQVNNGIYGLSAVTESDGQAYTYIVTGDSSNELKVILGGPGGDGTKFFPSGTYESPYFDALTTTAFNRVDATLFIPSLTSLSYQVAVASASGGSCAGATYTYLGPDGTAGSFYTATGGGIPFKTSGGYANPGRCFRYKANFTTTDESTSAALEDIRINYSP